MICPYCNGAMRLGSIDVYDTLSWTPKGEHRPYLSKLGVSPNGIRLAKGLLIVPSSKDAYCCTKCRKIIISF